MNHFDMNEQWVTRHFLDIPRQFRDDDIISISVGDLKRAVREVRVETFDKAVKAQQELDAKAADLLGDQINPARKGAAEAKQALKELAAVIRGGKI